MELSFKPNTIVLMVGPTNSGKSAFIKQHFSDISAASVLLSSDNIRRTLLNNPEAHKYDPCMAEVSHETFKVLMSLLESFTTYPVNAPLVIVDTRGYSEDFRNKVREIAQRNHYIVDCIVFDYKTAVEYTDDLDEKHVELVRQDVKRFRTDVLPNIRQKDYNHVYRIRSRAKAKEAIVTIEKELCTFDIEGKRIAIIGDVHECVEQFSSLCEKVGETGNTHFIQVGDWIDKGGNTAGIIDFMERFSEAGHKFIWGNHEAYVYRRLTNEITDQDAAGKDFEVKFFTSISTLKNDPDLAKRFMDLCHKALPFIKLVGEKSRTVYVTHSPCQEKYLGKVTSEAKRNQRNLSFRSGVDPKTYDVRDSIPFIYSEASFNKPLHVFGHLTHASEKLTYKNKVFLDTGCVNGGHLTAMVIENDRYDFVSVEGRKGEDAKPDFTDALVTNLTKPPVAEREFKVRDYDLSPDDHRFVRGVLRNGIRYISGTMAPAPSNDTELESLASGVKYFADRGVTSLVAEPKYMGSRAQVYLFNPVEGEAETRADFSVSRNGYVIKHVEGLDEAIKSLRDEITPLLSEVRGSWSSAIIDCELLPWSALGRGLIEHQFNSYGALVRSELETLASDPEFSKLDVSADFELDKRLNELLPVFEETLSIYSQEEAPYFKPFRVLELDGDKYPIDPGAVVNFLGEHVKYLNPLNESDVKETEEFFKEITVGRQMEGIVLKPITQNGEMLPKTVEYMKVRNEKYLTLVYGYDYQLKYDRLLRQKNISGKAAISIRESKLGRQMLEAKSEAELFEPVVKMIAELKKEKELDPRL